MFLWPVKAVFSLTLTRSPMASRFYQRASDFLNYSPRLDSDILVEAEQKSGKKKFYSFLKICFPKQLWHFSFIKADLIMIMPS